MMGRLNHDQRPLFYSFRLEDAVPDDHLVRAIAGVLDLSWVHAELAPYYPKLGRPSIDPLLMIRMLVVGYVFAIRSERALRRDVQVNLAYRWFCGLNLYQVPRLQGLPPRTSQSVQGEPCRPTEPLDEGPSQQGDAVCHAQCPQAVFHLAGRAARILLSKFSREEVH